MPRASRLAVLPLVAVAACAGAGGDGGAPDGGGLDTDCAETLGGGDAPIFDRTDNALALIGDESYLAFSGALWDGPAIAFHQEADRVGACRLLTYAATACDPPCTGGDLCVDGACATPPAAVSAGTLTLTGVAAAPVEIEPADGQYYWSASTSILDVPALRAVGEGDAFGPFDLTACAVEPPLPIDDWSAALAARGAGEDVTLAWSNPYATARVYLRMTTGIGTHGGISPVEIECEGPDTGSLTLPGAFLDDLYDGPYWACGECGDNRLLRYHAAEAEVGGATVRLDVRGAAYFWYRP